MKLLYSKTYESWQGLLSEYADTIFKSMPKKPYSIDGSIIIALDVAPDKRAWVYQTTVEELNQLQTEDSTYTHLRAYGYKINDDYDIVPIRYNLPESSCDLFATLSNKSYWYQVAVEIEKQMEQIHALMYGQSVIIDEETKVPEVVKDKKKID